METLRRATRLHSESMLQWRLHLESIANPAPHATRRGACRVGKGPRLGGHRGARSDLAQIVL